MAFRVKKNSLSLQLRQLKECGGIQSTLSGEGGDIVAEVGSFGRAINCGGKGSSGETARSTAERIIFAATEVASSKIEVNGRAQNR